MKYAVLAVIALWLVQAALIAGLIYVAVHFLLKAW